MLCNKRYSKKCSVSYDHYHLKSIGVDCSVSPKDYTEYAQNGRQRRRRWRGIWHKINTQNKSVYGEKREASVNVQDR